MKMLVSPANRTVFPSSIMGHALPLLPPTPVSGRAAGGARGGAEFGAGLARVGRLEDLAAAARSRRVVGRGFARAGAAGAIGQGFRAVHFIEVRFVDFGGVTTRGPPTPTLPRKGGGRRGAAARRSKIGRASCRERV